MGWQEILEKVPYPTYEYSQSRTSIWRRKKNIWNAKKLYFWVWLSFNIDWTRINEKKIYKKQIETIMLCLSTKQLDDIYSWVKKNYKKFSKNISIKDVNSTWKLFMHILWVLPYVKENFKWWNIEGFIARILYNCTRSWYSNWCKNHFNNVSKLND